MGRSQFGFQSAAERIFLFGRRIVLPESRRTSTFLEKTFPALAWAPSMLKQRTNSPTFQDGIFRRSSGTRGDFLESIDETHDIVRSMGLLLFPDICVLGIRAVLLL